MFKNISIALIVLALGLAVPPARAAIKVYDDRDQFLTETGAVDVIGEYPDTGNTSEYVSEGVAGEITVRARSLVTREATPLLPIENPPGLELLVSRGAGKELSEDIDVALAGDRYAFGFDFVEPSDVPGFVDSLFRVSLYRNTLLVDRFTFAPDDDMASFVGVWSDEPFNRVEIRETTGTNENEYYGHFYTGANAPDDSDPSVFNQLAKLLADDGGPEAYFGGAVALDGDTAIIAAVGERNNTGAAYVFVRQGAGWRQQAKLLADDGDPDDDFGGSVALDGDTAIIGAIGDDDNGSIAGAAYVFVRQGTRWRQQAKLLAKGGAPDDAFGASVALDGDTALIGAGGYDDNGSRTGAAYVFVRQNTGWVQQDKLLANDGNGFDDFGGSVALDADTAIIGARGDDDNGSNAGSAYVFVRQNTSWVQQDKLLANDKQAGDRFGWSVALDGDKALIGAPGDDDNGIRGGAAYVFVRQNTGWVQQDKLLANDRQADDRFGDSVALDGDTALVGAPSLFDDNRAGAAHVFVRKFTGWKYQSKLLAENGQDDDYFGHSVALYGDTALIGAYGDDDRGKNAGAAYVFGDSPAGDGMPWIPLLLLDD